MSFSEVDSRLASTSLSTGRVDDVDIKFFRLLSFVFRLTSLYYIY